MNITGAVLNGVFFRSFGFVCKFPKMLVSSHNVVVTHLGFEGR